MSHDSASSNNGDLYELYQLRMDELGECIYFFADEAKKYSRLSIIFQFIVIVLGLLVILKGTADLFMIMYQADRQTMFISSISFLIIGCIITITALCQNIYKPEWKAGGFTELTNRSRALSRNFMSLQYYTESDNLRDIIQTLERELSQLHADARIYGANLVLKSQIDYTKRR